MMAVVYMDKHGLFVRVGGFIARPEVDQKHQQPMIELNIDEGDHVSARNLGDGYIQITTKPPPHYKGAFEKQMVFWFIHGQYKHGDYNSEVHWNPKVEPPPYVEPPLFPEDHIDDSVVETDSVDYPEDEPLQDEHDEDATTEDPEVDSDDQAPATYSREVDTTDDSPSADGQAGDDNSPEEIAVFKKDFDEVCPLLPKKLGGFKVRMTLDINIEILED